MVGCSLSTDGTMLGSVVTGTFVGICVKGGKVGRLVGNLDGKCDGTALGTVLGTAVGDPVGASDCGSQ